MLFFKGLGDVLRQLHLIFGELVWSRILFIYGFEFFEYLSLIAFLALTIESIIRYRSISRVLLYGKPLKKKDFLIKVLQKRILFLFFYIASIFIRLSYLSLRCGYAFYHYKNDEYMSEFFDLALIDSLPAFIELTLLGLSVATLGLIKYWYETIRYKEKKIGT